MTARLLPRLLLGAALLALCAGALDGRAAEVRGQPMSATTPAAERPPVTAAGPPAPVPGEFHLAPLDSYAEVLRRPLFAPDRRAHEAAQAVAAPPQSFTLRGIVVEAGAHYALVDDGPATRRVTEGETLGDGTVKQIERDRLVLEINGVDTAVKLFDPKANGEPTPGLSTTGGIPSQMPPGFPTAPAIRPPLSGG